MGGAAHIFEEKKPGNEVSQPFPIASKSFGKACGVLSNQAEVHAQIGSRKRIRGVEVSRSLVRVPA